MLCLTKPTPFLLAAGLLAVTGCGPMYSTEYRFTPPRGSQGGRCISSCEAQQDRCEDRVNQEYSRCEARKEREYTRCTDRISRDKGRGPKWNECGAVESCSSSTAECEELYRSCYRSCGGSVVEERTCVANCEEEKPTRKR